MKGSPKMATFQAIKDWHWEVTRRCNQNCSHCITGDQITGEMDKETAIRAITRMSLLGGKRLNITGGEPFVRKDLLRLIKHANRLGFSVSVITNGISKEVIMESIENNLIDCLGISIDGDRDAHDLIRGKGSYNKTCETLKLVIRAGITVTVYITLNALSIGQIHCIVSDLVEMGVTSLHFNEINANGRAMENSTLFIKEQEQDQKLEYILSQFASLIEVGKIFSDSTCTISPAVAYMNTMGDVYSCSEIGIFSPESKIAHIFDVDFLARFRDHFNNVRFPSMCRYSTYTMNGVVLCLNNHFGCLLCEKGAINE